MPSLEKRLDLFSLISSHGSFSWTLLIASHCRCTPCHPISSHLISSHLVSSLLSSQSAQALAALCSCFQLNKVVLILSHFIFFWQSFVVHLLSSHHLSPTHLSSCRIWSRHSVAAAARAQTKQTLNIPKPPLDIPWASLGHLISAHSQIISHYSQLHLIAPSAHCSDLRENHCRDNHCSDFHRSDFHRSDFIAVTYVAVTIIAETIVAMRTIVGTIIAVTFIAVTFIAVTSLQWLTLQWQSLQRQSLQWEPL